MSTDSRTPGALPRREIVLYYGFVPVGRRFGPAVGGGVLLASMLACGPLAPVEPPGGAAPEGPPPDGFVCPSGARWVREPPGEGTLRLLPGTEVHGCRGEDGLPAGPHLERWPDGAIAAEGRWTAGRRDGVWTTWEPDGAFRSQITWAAGVQEGARREVARDGRIVEIRMEDDVAVAIVTLPPGAAMPEWDGGRRVEGTKYRARAETPAAAGSVSAAGVGGR